MIILRVMKLQKPLEAAQIGSKIRDGFPFWVGTNAERKAALTAARFLGRKISTRADEKLGGFNIAFLNFKSK